jgi:uncharacterized protein with NRDE domain
MCLIAWRWQPGADPALLVLANRDEFYARPTRPMHWWDATQTLAGQDLQAGGTWLGVNRNGKFAALTNYRSPDNFRPDAPSRGSLVSDFLNSDIGLADYLAQVQARCADYNPFNLLLCDGQQFMGLESRHARAFAIAPGLGAVSNADFDTPWPKLVRLKQGLGDAMETAPTGGSRGGKHRAASETEAELLFGLLRNTSLPHDSDLPQTGIPLERERALSCAFIQTPDYGTRASTLVNQSGSALSVWERSFDPRGATGTLHFTS